MTAPAIHPQRGTMPVLQFCTPAQLDVDRSYQRPTDAKQSRTLINRIAREWDWGLYQPLVVARRADGRLYVVDGQHRLEAARVRGDVAQLPCVITSYDGAADEAAAFVAINQQRRPLTRMNLFRAALAAGGADAMVIEQMIARAGLRLTASANAAAWRPGWINNIAGIQHCHYQHGEKVTRLALEALAKGFPGQVLRHCGTLFGAIVPLVVAQGDALSSALLHDLLKDDDADTWMDRFRAAAIAGQTGTALAARHLLAAAYAEAAAE